MAKVDRETFERRSGVRSADFDQLKQIPLFAGRADDTITGLLVDAAMRRASRRPAWHRHACAPAAY
jgi:hypothetical protein